MAAEAFNLKKLIHGDGKAEFAQRSEIMASTVDRRGNYVKRCFGSPGDSIQIINGGVYVNGEKEGEIENRQHNYIVRTNGKEINPVELERIGIRSEDMSRFDAYSSSYVMALTSGIIEQLRTFTNVADIIRQEDRNMINSMLSIFPFYSRYPWTEDNF